MYFKTFNTLPSFYFFQLFFNLFIVNLYTNLNYLTMDTFIIILTVLLMFAKLFLYVALIVFTWVLIKKYSPTTAQSIQNMMPKDKKGDK